MPSLQLYLSRQLTKQELWRRRNLCGHSAEAHLNSYSTLAIWSPVSASVHRWWYIFYALNPFPALDDPSTDWGMLCIPNSFVPILLCTTKDKFYQFHSWPTSHFSRIGHKSLSAHSLWVFLAKSLLSATFCLLTILPWLLYRSSEWSF